MKRLPVEIHENGDSYANVKRARRSAASVIEIQPPLTSMPIPDYQLFNLDESFGSQSSMLPTPAESSIGSSTYSSTFYTPQQNLLPNHGFMLPISPISTAATGEDQPHPADFGIVQTKSLDVVIKLISTLSRTIVDYDVIITNRFSQDRRREYVNYISKLSRRFRFHPETTWIGIYYFDKYLSMVRVTQSKQFYLLAIGSLYLASKMEEELVEPDCSEICKKCSEHANVKDIRRTERKLLNVLGWDFIYVTPHALICNLLESVNMQYRIQDIIDSIQPFLDKIVLDVECLQFDVFVIAVACLKMELCPTGGGRVLLRSQSKLNREWEPVRSVVSWLLTEFSIPNHSEFWSQIEIVCQRTDIGEEDDL